MNKFYCANQNIRSTTGMRRLIILLLTMCTMTGFLYAQPHISDFAPVNGNPGTTLTINGDNFDPAPTSNIVYFGTVRAVVNSATSNQLVVTVPSYGASRRISVTSHGLTGLSKRPFVYSFGGTDTSFVASSFAPKADLKIGSGYPYSGPGDIQSADLDGDGKPDLLICDQEFQGLTFVHNESTPGNNIFGSKTGIYLYKVPLYATLADFDGDGKLDIAATFDINNSFGVFLNTSTPGNISFGAPQFMNSNSGVSAIAAADFDGDGRLEVVAANRGWTTVTVYRNTSTPGTLSFSYQQEYEIGTHPQSIAIADFDGDGREDISVALTETSKVVILKNTSIPGSVSFYLPAAFTVSGKPGFVVAGDFDGDGLADIAFSCYEQKTLNVLRNTSDPNFYHFTETVFADTSGPARPVTDDFDGDGIVDIAVTDFTGSTISVFKNTGVPGQVNFVHRFPYPAGTTTIGIVAVDFDGDGKSDLLSANYNAASISSLLNTANAPGISSFSPDTSYTSKTITIRGANFTGATGVTIGGSATTTYTVVSQSIITAIVPTTTSGDISVITPYGTATKPGFYFLNPPVIYYFTPNIGTAGTVVRIEGANFQAVRGVRIGGVQAQSYTVTSAGHIDAVVGSGAVSGNVVVTTIIDSFALAGFTYVDPPVISFFSPHSGAPGAAITFHGSHFMSISTAASVSFGGVSVTPDAITDSTMIVKLPAGVSYGPITLTSNGLQAVSREYFTTSFPGAGSIFSASSFKEKKAVDYAGILNLTAVRDEDKDGKAEVIFGGNYGDQRVAINKSVPGSISLSATTSIGGIYYQSGSASTDLDGDGAEDLVTSILNARAFTATRNSGASQLYFNPVQVFGLIPSSSSTGMTVADIDNDGRPDIILSSTYPVPGIVIFRNASQLFYFQSISFESPIVLPTLAGNPASITSADLDGDGKKEIIIGYSDRNVIQVFHNQSLPGKILLDAIQEISTAYPVTGLLTADLDNDGKPDLVTTENTTISNGASATITVFSNTSQQGNILLNQGTTIPITGASPRLTAADLDGDSWTDIAAFQQSGHNIWVLKNTGAGVIGFKPSVAYSVTRTITGLLAADLDNDGKPDLVLGTTDNNASTVTVLRNQVGEALIVPSGANPLTADVYNRLTIDPSVQTHNGSPYVQRHYDIEPQVDAATATATITLYFSQSDFDNYNSFPGHGANLPINPSDNSGKAALRIFQFHGFSASGLPGTYSGEGKEIDPDDALITWNPSTELWEVTFDVTGFSGFFVGTRGSSLLPVSLLSFSGEVIANHPALKWQTSSEINTAYFELQRSPDGFHFDKAATITAHGNSAIVLTYSFTDMGARDATNFYRLKMADVDGDFTYSKVIHLRLEASIGLELYPNPAHQWLTVEHPASRDAFIRIFDAAGRMISTIQVDSNTKQTLINTSRWAHGSYHLEWSVAGNSTWRNFIVN